MSIILDALKKLEEERKRSHPPDLTTEHHSGTVGRGRLSLWSYIVLFALLMNASVLVFWLIQRDTHEVSSTEVHENKASGHIVREDDSLSHMKAKESVEQARTDTSITETSGDREIKDRTLLPEGVPPAEERERTLARHTPPSQEKEIGRSTTEDESIPDIDQLPSSVRDDLPEIKISGHVYFDTPEDRLVIVNGKSAREGDTIASGLTLEEITTTGVIFIYENRRFSMKGF